MVEAANSKALILKCIPYGENDRIVSLFTPHLGKISAFAKSSPFLQPLSLIEANFTPGKKELYKMKEPKLLDPLLSLRDRFPHLKAALELSDFTLRFFPQEVAKPHIFDLLLAYLKKLPAAKNPENFYYSFVLKVLHVEGFLDPETLSGQILPLIISRKWDEIDALSLKEDEKESILTHLSLIR